MGRLLWIRCHSLLLIASLTAATRALREGLESDSAYFSQGEHIKSHRAEAAFRATPVVALERNWLDFAVALGMALLGLLLFLRLGRIERRLADLPEKSQLVSGEKTQRRMSVEKLQHGASATHLNGSVRSRKVVRAVLTGGPCGGKSTALAHISERMDDLGFTVYMLPEASTLMFTSGCPFPVTGTPAAQLCWEAAKLRLQEAMENEFISVAVSQDSPTLLLCDRGMVDSKAYVPSVDDWYTMLEDNNWTEEQLLDRYDVVVHLTTAAHGAPGAFTNANNAARTETLEEAQAADNRCKAAWKDHPSIVVVDNSTAFEEKVGRVFKAVADKARQFADTTGGRQGRKSISAASVAVAPLGGSKKIYLITSGSARSVWPQVEEDEKPINLTYTFLHGGSNRMLRRRGRGQNSTFILSTRVEGCGQKTERITRRFYKELLSEADPNAKIVEVLRYTFLDGAHMLRLDTVTSAAFGNAAEVGLSSASAARPRLPTDIGERLQLVSFDVPESELNFEAWGRELSLKDVSNDKAYTMYGIARLGS